MPNTTSPNNMEISVPQQADITIVSHDWDISSYAKEYVRDANGVAQEIARGDLVRIVSKRSEAYDQVGHVRGLTPKRVKVYLTERNFDRSFEPKNLLFLEPSTSPAAQAYHKKWKTIFRHGPEDEEPEVDSDQDSDTNPTERHWGHVIGTVCAIL
mmetsp:Transcript_10104/g.14575  ORF Transcript_10104/g.14575 Transcript_10104/m.14575 type:complete len:155 (-) Transcript_10104:4406-4870(-)